MNGPSEKFSFISFVVGIMENTGHGQATHKCLSDMRSTYLTGELSDGNGWWLYALAVAGEEKF